MMTVISAGLQDVCVTFHETLQGFLSAGGGETLLCSWRVCADVIPTEK